jgi:hypothetical protein
VLPTIPTQCGTKAGQQFFLEPVTPEPEGSSCSTR